MRDYTERNREHKARRMREFYAERKKRPRDLKQQMKCSRCGFDHPAALEFHHRDPSTKKFKVSEKAWSRSWDVVLEEIEKCDVLCSNCHRIKHDGEGRPRKYD